MGIILGSVMWVIKGILGVWTIAHAPQGVLNPKP